MKRALRIIMSAAILTGLIQSPVQAQDSDNCFWTYDGCICSSFGSCTGQGCTPTGWCAF